MEAPHNGTLESRKRGRRAWGTGNRESGTGHRTPCTGHRASCTGHRRSAPGGGLPLRTHPPSAERCRFPPRRGRCRPGSLVPSGKEQGQPCPSPRPPVGMLRDRLLPGGFIPPPLQLPGEQEEGGTGHKPHPAAREKRDGRCAGETTAPGRAWSSVGRRRSMGKALELQKPKIPSLASGDRGDGIAPSCPLPMPRVPWRAVL